MSSKGGLGLSKMIVDGLQKHGTPAPDDAATTPASPTPEQ
jgi:Rod binding domain-containing protein